MANTNPGGEVATLKTADLLKLWGEDIPVKKSAADGKRYPLYLSTPTGTVFFNTARGQDFLLETAQFFGADSRPSPGTPPEQPPAPAAAIPEASPLETPDATQPETTLLGWLDKPIF